MSSNAVTTGKVAALIDQVQSAVPYGLTRGEVNELVLASFSTNPVRAIVGVVLNREVPADYPLRYGLIEQAQQIILAALSADQETLDALFAPFDGSRTPRAVAP